MLNMNEYALLFTQLLDRKLGWKAMSTEKEHVLRVEFDENKFWEISLSNSYNVFISELNKGADYIDAITASLINHIETLKEASSNIFESFEDVRKRIYPYIKEAGYLNGKVQKEQFAINKPLCDEFGVTCIIDGKNSIKFVTKHHLEEWNITSEELYKIALTNFKRDFDKPLKKVKANDDMVFYVFDTKDSYDSTKILLENRIEEVVKKYKGKCNIAIPSRDLLIIYSTDNPTYKMVTRKLVADYYQGSPYSISPYCYKYKNGVLTKDVDNLN